ncbi:MAG: hypothetical protein NZ519_13890, partial [Bacteroidia bacterium]|nr:hypothetical protein [Bacteroidia bacterium]
VYGQATGAAGTALTVGTFGRAFSTSGSAYGVYGVTNSNAGGIGVVGLATATSGAATGVYGQTASATGLAVRGVNTHASGTGGLFSGNNLGGSFLTVGSGAAAAGTIVGLYALGTSTAAAGQGVGVVGVGNNSTTTIYIPTTGAGVVGVGQYYGVMGFATTTVNTDPLNNNGANGTSASAGGYFEVQNGAPTYTPQTWAYVAVRDNTATLRKIIGPGTVNTIVPDVNGKLVTMSAPEAPENFFQDYGTGQLVNGRAHITLDPIFAKNIVVNQEHPLRVFIQLEGDCKGVYVTNKTQYGFDVIELNGGTSNVPFTWMVTANRADEVNPDGTIAKYSAERFVPAPLPVSKNKLEVKEVPRTPESDYEVKVPNVSVPATKEELAKNNK